MPKTTEAIRTEVERILAETWTDPQDYLQDDGSYRLSWETEYNEDGEPVGQDIVEDLNAVLPEGWTADWLGIGYGSEEDLVVSPPEE